MFLCSVHVKSNPLTTVLSYADQSICERLNYCKFIYHASLLSYEIYTGPCCGWVNCTGNCNISCSEEIHQ